MFSSLYVKSFRLMLCKTLHIAVSVFDTFKKHIFQGTCNHKFSMITWLHLFSKIEPQTLGKNGASIFLEKEESYERTKMFFKECCRLLYAISVHFSASTPYLINSNIFHYICSRSVCNWLKLTWACLLFVLCGRQHAKMSSTWLFYLEL